jgi:hypothetical protein
MIAEDLKKWSPLQDFLHKNDLCIALSEGQIPELSDFTELHQNLGTLLSAVPTIITKTHEEILDQEINSFPEVITPNIISGYVNENFGTDIMQKNLSSKPLSIARKEQRESALQMQKNLVELMPNFPPKDDGKYHEDQADDFVWAYVLQLLAETHPTFLTQFRDNASAFTFEPFRYLSLRGYVIFYKYYLHRKKSNHSDFGDLFHLNTIPYCDVVIVERDLCNVLNHIKKNHSILSNIIIKNIDFFEDWSLEE